LESEFSKLEAHLKETHQQVNSNSSNITKINTILPTKASQKDVDKCLQVDNFLQYYKNIQDEIGKKASNIDLGQCSMRTQVYMHIS
jgi:hypothetical protein